MTPYPLRFFVLFLCSLAMSCTIPSADEEYFNANKIGSYKLLVDLGGNDLYNFAFTPSGWRIISYYRSFSRSIPDSIFYCTEKTRTAYVFSVPTEFEDSLSNWTIDRLVEIKGTLYVTGWRSYTGGKELSLLLAYDTLTQKAEVLYSDTIWQLRFAGSDSASIYYTTKSNGGKFRFAITDKSLSNSFITNFKFEDTLQYLEGYFISIGGDSICKMDTAAHRRLWKTVLPPLNNYSFVWINNVMIHDGYIYVCGATSTYGGEGYSAKNAFVAKLDRNGAIVWYDTYYTGEFQKIAFDSFGNLVCIGSICPYNGRYYYLLVTSIDGNGAQITQSIISNNAGRESNWRNLSIAKIEKVETGLVHLIIFGGNGDYRGYYAQAAY